MVKFEVEWDNENSYICRIRYGEQSCIEYVPTTNKEDLVKNVLDFIEEEVNI